MKTILLIEDNNAIRENTCELLEMEGYKVIVALNGKTGIILADEHRPDAIVCDIMMPEADGYEVFNTLRASLSTNTIPLIFLTASAEKKEVAAGLEMGACSYIRKPFDPEELFQALRQCLNERIV